MTLVTAEDAACGATLVPMSFGKSSTRQLGQLRAFLASQAFYIGLGLYVASFALPAVSLNGQPMIGWGCAWVSLWLWTNPKDSSVLVVFGGLINPLAILYAVLRLSSKASKLRGYLTSAIFLCIPFTWLCLLDLKMEALVGHIVWIVGLLLLIVSEAAVHEDFDFARYGSIFAGLVLGWCGYHWVVTPRLDPTTERDHFFYSVSTHFKAPESCNKIGRYASSPVSREPGYQIAYLRSRCYYDLAQMVNDPKLCDQVRPLASEGMDGSRYSPAECKSRVPDPANQTTAYLRREVFVQLMEAAGFEKQALEFRRRRYQDKAFLLNMYEQVRQDVDFVKALRSIPSKLDWRSQPRPATGPEYLFNMLATDESDEVFCNKISPVATYQFPDGKTFSLRSACMLHVGFYTRFGFCDYLPSINSSDLLVSEYDSKESCSEILQTERYPDWGEPPDAKPVFFPNLQSFQSTLEELGYTPGRTVATTPRATFDDYIQFFLYAAAQGGPELQSQFVRQVMSLK